MSQPPRSHASSLPPAELDRRFYAFTLDRLIAWTLVAVLAVAAYALLIRHDHLWAGLVVVLGAAVLVGLGFGLLLGLRGTSPGKAALGLRLVNTETGLPVGVGPALLRSLVLGGATLPTFGLGVATLAWTAVMDRGRQRRGWHDHLAGSIVVDIRPVPVAVEEEMTAPRQIVNLTAMRLVPTPQPDPVSAPARPPVPTPPPRPRPPAEESPAEQTLVRPHHAASAVRWRVTFDSGESLVVEGLTLVGRRPEARPGERVRHLLPLRSQDMSLSKTHAQLQVAADGVLVVMDRGSTNGSVLLRQGMGRALSAGRPASLLDGDRVRLGDREMSVTREA